MSAEEYEYILLLVDSFTKFLFLLPFKSLSGSETCEFLKTYLSIFDITKTFVSDRSTNLTDQSVLSELGIHHHLIAKSSPQSKGQVERYVATVLN